MKNIQSYVQVVIPRGSALTLYNPHGKERPRISGTTLYGTVEEIDGVLWAIFPTQRHLGVPLTDCNDDRFEYDLETAEFYGHVESYAFSSAPFTKETTP